MDPVTFGYEDAEPPPPPQAIVIDLKGVDLLIGTPCATGRYDRAYVRAFLKSGHALQQWGAKVDWAEMPYCADLSLARAKLFGTFHRKKRHTHFLKIDDDMGWEAQDIARLLMLKRDFVAAVGQKKTDPMSDTIEFAFNLSPPEGGPPFSMKLEPHTGLMEVPEVGAAFTLLSRNVADRMAEAYSDLQFVNQEGLTDYALYLPTVVNRRYLSEDYAFCYRWREIGGHIHIAPDIRLKHAGVWTWDAAMTDALIPMGLEPMKDVA